MSYREHTGYSPRAEKLETLTTTVFGKTDFRPDGSYVATQWFSIFMIPVVPLRSFRVFQARHLPKGAYKAWEETALNLKQVAAVYSYLVFCLLWAFCFPYVATEYLLDKPIWFFLASLLGMIWLPVAIPRALRRRAKRRSRSQQFHEPQAYRARA